jgi:peroxiredoxin
MQLHRERAALQTLNAQVVLISFSSTPQALRWRAETHVDFPLLLDPTRSVYRAYGLGSSIWRVWQPKVWWRYATMMLRGWRWRGIRDDPHQLGGDFIIDTKGILRFKHASVDPTDRPSTAELLTVLKKVNE